MSKQLNHDDLRCRFEQRIIPEYLKSQFTDGKGLVFHPPRFVSVGGQPGAGKGGILIIVKGALPGAVIVNGDDLRAFHPDYERLMHEEPLRMPEVTASAAGQWVGWSNEYLRQQQVSAIVETTLRDAKMLQGEFTAFKNAGYETELRVVAVPLELSRAGTVSRYIQQVMDFGSGRWTASSAHDEAAANVRETVRTLVGSGVVDRVVVQNRSGQVFYDALLSTERAEHAENTAQAVDQARNVQSLTADEARNWIDTTRTAIRDCDRFSQQDPDLLAVIQRLASIDAVEVVAQAYPGNKDAQREALESIQRAARIEF